MQLCAITYYYHYRAPRSSEPPPMPPPLVDHRPANLWLLFCSVLLLVVVARAPSARSWVGDTANNSLTGNLERQSWNGIRGRSTGTESLLSIRFGGGRAGGLVQSQLVSQSVSRWSDLGRAGRVFPLFVFKVIKRRRN